MTEQQFDAWVTAIESFAEQILEAAHALRVQAEVVKRAKDAAMQRGGEEAP